MDSCDILIVGGGPAGSSCAWALLHSGLDVLLIDRATFPRDKLCGGWITPHVLQSLEIDSQHYARGRVLQPIHGFRVSCMGQRETEIGYQRAVSYGIRRCEFDDYLLRRCGARVREGVAVTHIGRSGGEWIVNREIRARLLVGAGGHFCPVGRMVRGKPSAQLVLAQEIEFEMDPQQAASCAIRGPMPELYFCRDITGYGWCFRKNDYLNIGLGRLDQHALADHVSRFVQWLEHSGKIGFTPPAAFKGHPYLLFRYGNCKCIDDAVMLLGDAAGLAYPQSGEGIRTAVDSGILAAAVIQHADGRYSRETLHPYPALLDARFGNGLGRIEKLGRYVPRALRDACARLLFRNPRFCRRVVEDWFLHASDEPLTRAVPPGTLVPADSHTPDVASSFKPSA